MCIRSKRGIDPPPRALPFKCRHHIMSDPGSPTTELRSGLISLIAEKDLAINRRYAANWVAERVLYVDIGMYQQNLSLFYANIQLISRVLCFNEYPDHYWQNPAVARLQAEFRLHEFPWVLPRATDCVACESGCVYLLCHRNTRTRRKWEWRVFPGPCLVSIPNI
jgi:hypothetical protein